MTLADIFRNSFELERAHTDTDRRGDTRDAYERDYARIVHSGAFRTLQGKAQIHSPNWSGHLRTRVTHSLEVAQIGRSIAHNIGLPANLVEACCLAHDLGHRAKAAAANGAHHLVGVQAASGGGGRRAV